VSPNLRRAWHQALDIVLDAIAEEGAAEPKKKRRGRARADLPPLPKDVTAEELARVKSQLAKAGYRA
jgi:hypothetical protein